MRFTDKDLGLICPQHHREIKAGKVRDFFLARPSLENGHVHCKWNSSKSKDSGARWTYSYIQAPSLPACMAFEKSS